MIPFAFNPIYMYIGKSWNVYCDPISDECFRFSSLSLHEQCSQRDQGSHRLEKYLNLEGFLEKSLKIKSALKSAGKSLKSFEKSLNSTIFYRTALLIET